VVDSLSRRANAIYEVIISKTKDDFKEKIKSTSIGDIEYVQRVEKLLKNE